MHSSFINIPSIYINTNTYKQSILQCNIHFSYIKIHSKYIDIQSSYNKTFKHINIHFSYIKITLEIYTFKHKHPQYLYKHLLYKL